MGSIAPTSQGVVKTKLASRQETIGKLKISKYMWHTFKISCSFLKLTALGEGNGVMSLKGTECQT